MGERESTPGVTRIVDCDHGRRSGCKSFCCHLLVRLQPGEDPPGGRRHPLQSTVDKNPETGRCVHLDPDGRCEAWDERPQTCREYDCRDDPRLHLVLQEGFVSVTRLARTHATRVLQPPIGATRARAAAVKRIREDLESHPGPEDCGDLERQYAERARACRIELGSLTEGASVCGECDAGPDAPPGGVCCRPDPDALFNPIQLAMLKAGGTAEDAFPIRAVRASGCPFCSARGCVLPAEHRPSPCAAYACAELRATMGPAVASRFDTLARELEDATARFAAARAVRGLAELIDDTED